MGSVSPLQSTAIPNVPNVSMSHPRQQSPMPLSINGTTAGAANSHPGAHSSPRSSRSSHQSLANSPGRSNSPLTSSLFSPRAASFSPSGASGTGVSHGSSLWSPAPTTSDLTFFGGDEFFLPDDATSSSFLLNHREPTPTISDDVSHRVRKTSLSAAWADVQGSAPGGAFASSSSSSTSTPLLDGGGVSPLASASHVAGPSPVRKRKLSSAVLAGWGLDAPRPRKLSMSTIAALRARGGPPTSRRPQQQQQQSTHHANGTSHLHHASSMPAPSPSPPLDHRQYSGKPSRDSMATNADAVFSLPDPTTIFSNLFDEPESSSMNNALPSPSHGGLVSLNYASSSPASVNRRSDTDRSPSPAHRRRPRSNSFQHDPKDSSGQWISQYPILAGLPLVSPHQPFAKPSPEIFLTLIDSVPVFVCVVSPTPASPPDVLAPPPPAAVLKSPNGSHAAISPSIFLSNKTNGKVHHSSHGHSLPQPMDSVKTSRRPAPLNLAAHSQSSASTNSTGKPLPTTPTPVSTNEIVLLRRADESQYVNATTLLAAGGIESERERSIILSLERGRVRMRSPSITSPTSLRVTMDGTWIPLARARELAATCGLEGRLDEFLSDDLPGQFPELPAHVVSAAGGKIGIPVHHLEVVDDEVDLDTGAASAATLSELAHPFTSAMGRFGNGSLGVHDGTIAPSTTLRPRAPTAPLTLTAGVTSPPPHKKLRTSTAPSLGSSTAPASKRPAGPKLVSMPRAGSTFATPSATPKAPSVSDLPSLATVSRGIKAEPDTVLVSASGPVVHTLNPLSPKYATFTGAGASASVAPSAVASPVAREQLLKRKLGHRPKVVGVPTPHSFYSDVHTRLVKRRESITGATPKSPVTPSAPAAPAHDSDETEDEATEDEEEEEPPVTKNPLARLAAAGPGSLPASTSALSAPLIHPRVFHRTIPPVPATGRTNPVVVTEVQFDGTESSSDTSTSDELSSSSASGSASAGDLDAGLLHLPPAPPPPVKTTAAPPAAGGRGARTRATTRTATAASAANASGRVTRASSRAAARSRSTTAPGTVVSPPTPPVLTATRGRPRSGSRSGTSVAPMTSMDPAEYEQHLQQQQEQQLQLQQQVPLGLLPHSHSGTNAYLLAAIAAHSSSESETESDSD